MQIKWVSKTAHFLTKKACYFLFRCCAVQVVGLSFGGAVALEVCQKLVQHGKKALVIMLDTVCPRKGHLKLPDADVVPERYIMGKLEEELDVLYQKELKSNERILNDYNAMQHEKQPATTLRVVLLKAQGLDGTSRTLAGLEDLQNGWSWLQPEMYSVPGSHFTMCEPGYAERTAAAIRFVLSRGPVQLESSPDLWFHAVRHGDTFLYTRLMKSPEFGESWVHEECSSCQLTPLQIAAANDDVLLVKLLLSKGAQIVTSSGKSVVQCALEAESFRTFSFLSQYDLNRPDGEKQVMDVDLFGDCQNKKQLEIFSMQPGTKRRGQPWLRTLSAINASGDSAGHGIHGSHGPMGQQLGLLQKYR